MTHAPARFAQAALAVVGSLLLAHGLWIPAKAQLAQVLLDRSFERARASGEPPSPPWPWADFRPAARLVAPDGAHHVVLDDASGATLAFGPGHLPDTAPLADVTGNTALAGHRDTSFAFLEHLHPGDPLHLEHLDGTTTTYRVEWLRIVDRRDVDVLGPTSEPLLTLVTCWPFDRPAGGDERYVVRARKEVS